MKYSVNVMGKYGYSFAVESKGNETEESIINFCLDNELFDDADDFRHCTIAPLDEDEFDFFEDCCYEMS